MYPKQSLTKILALHSVKLPEQVTDERRKRMAKSKFVFTTFTKAVDQTSRTILFEKFNSEKESLISIINDNFDDNNIERLVKDVENQLEVRSFEEFLKRFEPVIYQTQTMKDGRPDFRYYSEPKPGAKPKKIVDEAFYKMVQEFIRMKAENGKSNLDTLYTKIDELLAPQQALDEARQKRKQLESLLKKYQQAEERHRTEEAKSYKKRLMKLEKEIYEKYKDDAFEMLPLAIADSEDKLETQIPMLGTNDTQTSGNTSVAGDAPKLLTGGRFVWNDSGKLDYQGAEEISDGDTTSGNDSQSSPLRLEMQKVADRMDTINQSETMQLAFLDSFSGSYSLAKVDEDSVYAEADRLREWTDIYKEAKERLYTAIISLVQKVLDVEMYFRHATDGLKDNKTPQPLIIANCTLKEAKDAETNLRKYLELENAKEDRRIWFAILPPVEHTEFVDSDDEDEDDWDKPEGFTGDSTNFVGMLNLLAEYGIVSFFNFKASEQTGFAKFNSEVLKSYEDIVGELSEKEHSVLCYPNFTVIPRYETDRLIMKAQSYKGENLVEETRLSINAVYVDAAYVAAGIMAASQNRTVLENKGYTCSDKYPCTRFELETEYSKFLTFFNMENFMNWTDSFREELNKNKIGFCFSSNDRIANGKKLTKTYFYYTRNNEGKPLYSVLTERAIGHYFKTNEFSAEDCNNAVNELNSRMEKMNSNPNTEYANAILKAGKGEKLDIDDSGNTINVGIKFAALSKVRSIVVSSKKSEED